MKNISKPVFLFLASFLLFTNGNFAFASSRISPLFEVEHFGNQYYGSLYSFQPSPFSTHSFFESHLAPARLNFVFAPTFTYTLPAFSRMNAAPELPFFCSMEYKVQNKLNFWIKLRAGTDADYMKSIQVYHQFDYH